MDAADKFLNSDSNYHLFFLHLTLFLTDSYCELNSYRINTIHTRYIQNVKMQWVVGVYPNSKTQKKYPILGEVHKLSDL